MLQIHKDYYEIMTQTIEFLNAVNISALNPNKKKLHPMPRIEFESVIIIRHFNFILYPPQRLSSYNNFHQIAVGAV